MKENEKVLEIGTGSGYQTAVLVKLKTKVYTIERQHDLYRKAIKKLTLLVYVPKLMKYWDGYLGIKEYAPFDKTLLTADSIEIPKKSSSSVKNRWNFDNSSWNEPTKNDIY